MFALRATPIEGFNVARGNRIPRGTTFSCTTVANFIIST